MADTERKKQVGIKMEREALRAAKVRASDLGLSFTGYLEMLVKLDLGVRAPSVKAEA